METNSTCATVQIKATKKFLNIPFVLKCAELSKVVTASLRLTVERSATLLRKFYCSCRINCMKNDVRALA